LQERGKYTLAATWRQNGDHNAFLPISQLQRQIASHEDITLHPEKFPVGSNFNLKVMKTD